MATEEQKKENLVRLLKTLIVCLAKGVYDLVGESSFAAVQSAGDVLIDIMQKEMGLEIGGSTPHEIGSEIARLFVDEWGFADNIEITDSSDTHLEVQVSGCKFYYLDKDLIASGVEKPYICPVMNAISSSINKVMGKRPQSQVEMIDKIKGSKLSFKFLT